MATLTVSQTKNYVRNLLPVGIDLIDFTNVLISATATFSASQADGAPILLDATIDGSSNSNHIVVGGGSIDASQWSFSNWSLTSDSITLIGSASGNTLTGSNQRDTLNGLDGNVNGIRSRNSTRGPWRRPRRPCLLALRHGIQARPAPMQQCRRNRQ